MELKHFRTMILLFGKAKMNTTRLLGVWAILSISWATLYVAVYALAGEYLDFDKVVSDVMSPIAALLIFGGAVVRISRGFRKT
jgi:membrane protein DedA with SNARE-associated domain